jgi:hypothetical protein
MENPHFRRFLRVKYFWPTGCAIIALVGVRVVFAHFRLMGGAAEKPPLSSTACPTFRETRSMPEAREQLAAASINLGNQDIIYVVGGQDSSGTVVNTVLHTEVLTEGQTDFWKIKRNAFATSFKYPALISTQDRLYVLGGKDGRGGSMDLVYQTQPQVGTGDTTWLPATSLPISVYLHAAVPLGDRIYVIGGCHHKCSTSPTVADVFSAKILGGGALSGWEPESSLARLAKDGLSAHAAVASEHHQCIYVIGGWLGSYSSGSPHRKVFRACVEGNGKLGAWQEEPEALPLVVPGADGIYYHSATIVDGRVFVIGGTVYHSGSLHPTDSVYFGSIDAGGHLGHWTACAHCLPGNVERQGVAVASSGTIYVIGGRDRSAEDVYDDVLFTPLLDFQKSAIPDGPVTYGDTINYTLRLTNLGVRDFETLDITDTVQTNVPTTLEFHLPGECSRCSNDTITCAVSNLTTGNITDLSFAVTISQPTPALHSAAAASQIPLVAFTSSTKTWQRTCSAARLEVVGVGLSDSNTLPITHPETIVSDIRVQAAFRSDGGVLDDVTFFSGGVPYPPIEPPSADDSSVVYEQDVPVSDVVGVTFSPVDGVQADALTAYFLRSTSEELSLAGHTMNRSVYRSTYTDVVKLPLPMRSGNVTVRAVVTSNNRPKGVIRLAAQAGGVSRTTTFTEPNRGHYLDIRELQLSGVPTTTNEVTVIAESPSENGESFSLVGLIAETECTPLRVSNTATVCENVDTSAWCWYDTYINTEIHVYLPIVVKNDL